MTQENIDKLVDFFVDFIGPTLVFASFALGAVYLRHIGWIG
jgi:hypothetical protein